MKSTLFVISLGAGLLLAAGSATAAAGLCAAEIETLEKTLATADAGTGPAGTGTATATEPGATQAPATAPTDQAAQGQATSPDEVLQQKQDAPTDSDAAEAGQMSTAAGIDEATDSLQRAKELDQKGDEAACLEQIAKAKGALGLQ